MPHENMQPGDLLEYRSPGTGIVTQWRVEAVLLGGRGEESVLEISSVTRRGEKTMHVPEPMTRGLTVVRPGLKK